MKRKSMVLAAILLTVSFGIIWAQTGGTVVQGNNVADKLAWLQAFAKNGGSYIVEVMADESIAPQSFEYSDKRNITITLRGVGANRTLSFWSTRSSNDWMFTIWSGVTLVLDNNITLKGRGNNDGCLVAVHGTFIMNEGSAITGNTNTFGRGGGVYIGEGTFTMNGGTISGNTAGGSYGNGGGVFMENGTFTMKGGTISGNAASSNGGGVYLNGGNFTKTGGTITGYTSDKANGNTVKNASGVIQNYKGHAVYAYGPKIREGTAGPGDNLSCSYNYSIWDGSEMVASDGVWDN